MIGIGTRSGLNPRALFPVSYVLLSTYVCIGFCRDLRLQRFLLCRRIHFICRQH